MSIQTTQAPCRSPSCSGRLCQAAYRREMLTGVPQARQRGRPAGPAAGRQDHACPPHSQPDRAGRRDHRGPGGGVQDQDAFQHERADAAAARLEHVIGGPNVHDVAIPVLEGDAADMAATVPPHLGSAPGGGQARARRAKARLACAASLLRWIYCLVVHDASWDPDVASGPASSRPAPAEVA
jgi:hypothetical protein